ncbi:MAG: phosphate ABC transporter permease PstA [Woeseiaceae bacterium]|nr:phosphate ABC transporter permease PstA [Woeseiaceae bacterium]
MRSRVQAGLSRRYRREFLFRAGGIVATLIGLGFLVLFFGTLIMRGASAFTQTQVLLDVDLDPGVLGVGAPVDVGLGDFDAVVSRALRDRFGELSTREERRQLSRLLSIDAAFRIRDAVRAEPGLVGQRVSVWVPASANIDMYVKGQVDASIDESLRPVSDMQIRWVEMLRDDGALKRRFNTDLFANGDSREPELAGIRGALVGSFFMLIVTLVLAFPLGVATAVYLEEFAPKNRWADLVEVNINNLAAVPSIVFGLLGLSLFIDWLSMPRSAPLVGGLVLTLLTLPVIIISARAAIKAVPPSIREGAAALGASRIQVVGHHVLPLALPGILTGTIIGMSRALGETAPLLMIGMVAFIVDVPGSLSDPATALPVQIYLWADSPERAFAEKTAAAILVLLGFLLLMNLAAVVIRKRMETRL